MERALGAWWAQVQRLNEEFKQYSMIGSSLYDKRKAAARQRAYAEITTDPERAYPLSYLADAGLLPSYQTGFKGSSQHRLVEQSIGAHPEPRRESASRASCVAVR